MTLKINYMCNMFINAIGINVIKMNSHFLNSRRKKDFQCEKKHFKNTQYSLLFQNVSYVTLTFVKISSKKKDQGKINDS